VLLDRDERPAGVHSNLFPAATQKPAAGQARPILDGCPPAITCGRCQEPPASLTVKTCEPSPAGGAVNLYLEPAMMQFPGVPHHSELRTGGAYPVTTALTGS